MPQSLHWAKLIDFVSISGKTSSTDSLLWATYKNPLAGQQVRRWQKSSKQETCGGLERTGQQRQSGKQQQQQRKGHLEAYTDLRHQQQGGSLGRSSNVGVCLPSHKHVRVRTSTHTRVHAHARAYMHTRACMCMHTHSHAHTSMLTRVHMRAPAAQRAKRPSHRLALGLIFRCCLPCIARIGVYKIGF